MSLKKSINEFGDHLGDKESLLEKNYPRIAEIIQLHWGYKEIYQYINKLLVVDKNRDRQGFPVQYCRKSINYKRYMRSYFLT